MSLGVQESGIRIKYHSAVEPEMTEPVARNTERKVSKSSVKGDKTLEYALFSSIRTAPFQDASCSSTLNCDISQYASSLAFTSLWSLASERSK